MSIALAQSAQNDSTGSAATLAQAFTPQNTVTGSYFWCYCYGLTTTATHSVSDSANGSWTQLDGATFTGGFWSHWFVLNSLGGGTKPTVTNTYSASTTFRGLFIAEITGTSGPDILGTPYHKMNNQTSPTAAAGNVTTGNMAPSLQPGLCIGASVGKDFDTTMSSFGSGWVDLTPSTFWASFGGKFGDAEYFIYSSFSSLAAQFTIAAAITQTTSAGVLFAQSAPGPIVVPPGGDMPRQLYVMP